MASTKRKRREQLPGWAWMLFGLCIGLGVALFVYLQSNELRLSDSLRELTSGMPPDDREQSSAAETAQPAVSSEDLPATADGDRSGAGAGAAGDSDEPGLSFYTRLRESEVIVPGSASAPERATAVRLPQTLELQAGSFPTEQGAESRLAALALLGVVSRIDPAVVNGTMHYRVIVGPLTERDEIDRVTRRLDRAEIEYFRRQVTAPD
ncbi:MAG: SPOR domain-containing protein [Gammaproteobacteria bacterium]|jgi:cell division protein FtsN